MRNRLVLACGLLSMAVFAAPAWAATTQSTPPRHGYSFAHGAVTHFRNWALAMDIKSEDTSNPNENGSFKVGFQARMAQYVVDAFPDGSGLLNTAFDRIAVRVNGNDVKHSIP